MAVPLQPSPFAVDAGNVEEKGGPRGFYRWEVLECVEVPLPKAFAVSSSLGGLGKFELSRYIRPITSDASAD